MRPNVLKASSKKFIHCPTQVYFILSSPLGSLSIFWIDFESRLVQLWSTSYINVNVQLEFLLQFVFVWFILFRQSVFCNVISYFIWYIDSVHATLLMLLAPACAVFSNCFDFADQFKTIIDRYERALYTVDITRWIAC